MSRRSFKLAVLAGVALVTSCGRHDVDATPEIEARQVILAINADVTLGDQCFYRVEERPADCFEQAPCMWSDAIVSISEDDEGRFRLQANSGGWELQSDDVQRTASAAANSPEALAQQLPDLLAELHDSPPPVTQACVTLRADQAMRFGDVEAFHNALTAQHVRNIELFAELAARD